MTKDNGSYLFIPIATKWLASGTDDDDDEEEDKIIHTHTYIPSFCSTCCSYQDNHFASGCSRICYLGGLMGRIFLFGGVKGRLSAEGAKLRLPMARSPSRLRDLGEHRKLPSGVWEPHKLMRF